MKQDVRSWHERYRAGRRGVSLAARRTPAGSTESWSWSSGTIKGNADRLKNSQQTLDGTNEH